ncbi:hypothetical protein K470DRAFT_280997 [Piedraia hortae CBS 480.64]|uniref:N-acetyltransferase domain-containing protein n=1 Tax=Piedraia hortae CBS 480.64 TaxID=1314780 RepID=A0A6A7C4F2_9PEZI|nr:hypothetical protein K470DRAFT_280997 [Piedraia hortae CBS 480.64]
MDMKRVDSASPEGDIRIVQLSEWKEASASLAEAFAEESSSLYILNTPDTANWTPEQKWALHILMMEFITYTHLLKGLVIAAGPNYDCVSLWMPPGAENVGLLDTIRSGMLRVKWALSKEGHKRYFDEFMPLLHDTKAQVLAERDNSSWYLVYIGTRPCSRGRGYARRVIEYVTQQADEEGKACYLESSSRANCDFYRKRGFEFKKEIYLQRAEKQVRLDIMVREPVMK